VRSPNRGHLTAEFDDYFFFFFSIRNPMKLNPRDISIPFL
jgi:hypothetical protein